MVILPSLAIATPPSEMEWCGYGCGPLPLSWVYLECQGYPRAVFYGTAGRHLLGPLLSIGPIEISLQLYQHDHPDPLPVFVGIRTDQSASTCREREANYVWQSLGDWSCHPDSLWVTSPVIDLPYLIGLGREYYVQIEGFNTYNSEFMIINESPHLACGRIRALSTSIAADASWGSVKSLFRSTSSPRLLR
jgi:hypothetical protein